MAIWGACRWQQVVTLVPFVLIIALVLLANLQPYLLTSTSASAAIDRERQAILRLQSSSTSPTLPASPSSKEEGGSKHHQQPGEGQHKEEDKKKRRAYAFYASNSQYACSALVNMARLHSLSGGGLLPVDVDLILIVTDKGVVDRGLLSLAKEKYGAKVYHAGTDFVGGGAPAQTEQGAGGSNNSTDGGSSSGGDGEGDDDYDMPRPKGAHSLYYDRCFEKLKVFLLPENTYSRIVYFDADSIVIRPPHHLLDLPAELALAAPPAYWLRGKRGGEAAAITSWFMSLRPSRSTYRRMKRYLMEAHREGRSDGIYDGDLLMRVLGSEVMVLPSIYGMIDSDFLPPPPPPPPPPPLAAASAAAPSSLAAGEEGGGGGPAKIKGGRHDAAVLDAVVNGTAGWVVHFSALGKPWQTDPAMVRAEEPDAHAGLVALHELWKRDAALTCPRGGGGK